MKYMKRAQIYKSNNGNNTFDPLTCEAHSYRWWRFVARIDGVVVFNNYRYSSMTSQHQRKMCDLLKDLNIAIDIVAPFPQGIPPLATKQDLFVLAEEMLCNAFLDAEFKREHRNAKARARRLAKRQAATAQFKANLDSITFDDVQAFRSAKLTVVR